MSEGIGKAVFALSMAKREPAAVILSVLCEGSGSGSVARTMSGFVFAPVSVQVLENIHVLVVKPGK